MSRSLALAGALSLLALTGCGDDPAIRDTGSGAPRASASAAASSPAATGLPKAEYIAKSEAVCTKANTELDALDAQPAETIDAVVAQLRQTGTIIRTATQDLAELAAPQPDHVDLEVGLIRPLQAQVAAFDAYLPAFEKAAAQGPEAIEALPEPSVAAEAPVEKLRAYGFDACADSAETS